MSYLPNINKISADNSSTSTLTAGSTFTGAWEDVKQYDSVVVAVTTDEDGNYSVQFSPDGVNLDSSLTRYYRTAQIEPPHRFTITRQYVRVVFNNTSASGQTEFRLQTSYGQKSELNAPLDSTLAQDFDATVVRATNYNYEVALGLRQGHTTWNKWGYNPDIDNTTATIWSVGGLFSPLSTARTLSIVSDDPDDDEGGTGAESIVITGIDADSLSQVEIVEMNGTTPVVTASTWLGINRMAVYAAGSSGNNEGTITATATTDLTAQAEIPADEGSTQQAFFFTQAGHTALMTWLFINAVKTSGGSEPVIITKVWVTSLVSGARYEVFRDSLDIASGGNHVDIRPPEPFPVGEKSLVEVQVETDTSNTAVSVRFSLIEIRDADA